MSSRTAARNVVGAQLPRISSVPPYASSTGDEAIELCRMAGLELDPWEQLVLRDALGERDDGSWAAFEVAILAPRQNGKNEIDIARQITGLFLLEEPLQIHSAHRFDTSLEAFMRLLALIESCPDFERRVKRVSRGHGDEGITLKDGSRIHFRTRTRAGGRGFTGDVIYFDEAMEIAESFHGALLPTLSARSILGDPQVWYTASAVDQWIHDNGVVLARLRERGHAGDDPALAYFEWSADAEDPEWAEELALDHDVWAQANPGLGIRISTEHIAREQRAMDPRTFAVERLGIGDWPETDPDADSVIAREMWRGLADTDSEADEGIVIAFDVSPDRHSASIGLSGRREDEKLHVEVVDHRAGVGWVAERLQDLGEDLGLEEIICDERSPAASLVSDCEELGLTVRTVSAQEYAQACGTFYDACDQDGLRHPDTAELNAAVRGAETRPLTDAWAWSRKSSAIDITPLVACTLAAWGARESAQTPMVMVA